MPTKALTRGLLTYVPGARRLLENRRSSGSSSSAYCYGTWLKHLTLLNEHGLVRMPHTVAELGPGSSLGLGLAAILSGSSCYYALDVDRRANTDANLALLDGLLQLFRRRAANPIGGWPDFSRHLDDNGFPGHILTDALLSETLASGRLAAIRYALRNPGSPADGIVIEYMVPWSDDAVLRPESVDLAISVSVLEHVVDLNTTYKALGRWLGPGGLMSHQIDFQSHGVSRVWNGYRSYPEWMWRIIVGRRPYLINRAPYSVHRSYMLRNDFDLICELRKFRSDGISRNKLARSWADIADEDLNCSGAFVQARKAASACRQVCAATTAYQARGSRVGAGGGQRRDTQAGSIVREPDRGGRTSRDRGAEVGRYDFFGCRTIIDSQTV